MPGDDCTGCKQIYSVWVKVGCKWHLSTKFLPFVDHKYYITEIAAYFTQATFDQLGTIDDIQGIAELVVPEGTFQRTILGCAPTC